MPQAAQGMKGTGMGGCGSSDKPATPEHPDRITAHPSCKAALARPELLSC